MTDHNQSDSNTSGVTNAEVGESGDASNFTPMTVREAWGHYDKHTSNASKIGRQLALAGIAIVWILATENTPVQIDASEFRIPLIIFVLALALDVLQYYLASLSWGLFTRHKEKKKEWVFGTAPGWINIPGNTCYWLKGIALGVGYFWLIQVLWPALRVIGGDG